MNDHDCDLCRAEQYTHWYHEDDTCWIADCEICSVPMVVWKHHGTEPPVGDVEHMLEALRSAGTVRFGHDEAVTLDTVMRQIPDHWHAHARDADWFDQRFQRPMSRFTGIGTPRIER